MNKRTFDFFIPGIPVAFRLTISEKDARNKKKIPLTSDQLRTTAEALIWIADVKDAQV